MKYSCDYSNRFSTTVCSTLSSWKRIGQVAFVAISLGLVVYYTSSKLSSRHAIKLKPSQPESRPEPSQPESRPEPSQPESRPELSSLINPLIQQKTLIDQEVMEFALQNIESFPPCVFKNRNPDMPELGEVLARLMTKFEWSKEKFLNLLEGKPIQSVRGRMFQDAPELNDDSRNPWLDEEIIDAADNYIKHAYAVSVKTFEMLPDFIEKAQKNEFVFKNKAKALVQQGAYQYITYFCLPRAFHDLRGCLVQRELPNGNSGFDNGIRVEQGNENHQKLLEGHVAKFYQSGTKQGKWRDLFNGYCEYVRDQIGGEDALFREDSRFVDWTKQVPDQIEWRQCRHTKKYLDSFFTPRTIPT